MSSTSASPQRIDSDRSWEQLPRQLSSSSRPRVSLSQPQSASVRLQVVASASWYIVWSHCGRKQDFPGSPSFGTNVCPGPLAQPSGQLATRRVSCLWVLQGWQHLSGLQTACARLLPSKSLPFHTSMQTNPFIPSLSIHIFSVLNALSLWLDF